MFYHLLHFSLDPTRLLLTFGACTTTQDKLQGNTALHWAIIAQNHTTISTLVLQGASLDIANAQVSTCFFNISQSSSEYSVFVNLCKWVLITEGKRRQSGNILK
jgi:ankyrin repeat protein